MASGCSNERVSDEGGYLMIMSPLIAGYVRVTVCVCVCVCVMTMRDVMMAVKVVLWVCVGVLYSLIDRNAVDVTIVHFPYPMADYCIV